MYLYNLVYLTKGVKRSHSSIFQKTLLWKLPLTLEASIKIMCCNLFFKKIKIKNVIRLAACLNCCDTFGFIYSSPPLVVIQTGVLSGISKQGLYSMACVKIIQQQLNE